MSELTILAKKRKENNPENRPASIFGKIYDFLASAKLALALLIVILVCCVAGVTVVRGEKAWDMIFLTFWFNGLLVLLVVNIAFCFFVRIWGRKLTLISFGMIMFHLSFVTILAGSVYNSLFYFRGVIRLTEGETLPSGDPQSYDVISKGRFFDFSKLKGETTLIKIHTRYQVDGQNKRTAYEIAAGEGRYRKQGILYITHGFASNDFVYFNDREGYSPLIILSDRQGREIYGAYVPLQSLKKKDGGFLVTSGTKDGPGSFPFPKAPLESLLYIQIAYNPSKFDERDGDVVFKVWPYGVKQGTGDKPLAEGNTAVGKKIRFGDYYLSVKEIRYWAAMTVRYEPGKPIVLASLLVGLAGMIITTVGRMARRRN